ncbi:IS6 family transposase [Legionella longbeachae]|uniref:Putative transposase n=1 Tax=Legionella longbeachae serogroup 1 (strain NSW150) TaxID=661367 RepID=D3HNG9_LEGLN|nr:IS6 family transposase [Legionella longbeachae]VEE00958.1 transposase [Legionella oakridgensis]HBD7399071.1 IS6 family transposase [Legionella pneumophila]ARB92655.1 IS6 family transposase [Legionella longbeachae]ARM34170.1 IS6 family transposase [Legionella longbeachae]EEZ96578.1 putative transposase [Legionella longbeachae D-4968]
MRSTKPAAFKWRHFHGEVILQCVRWYCKYGISYRDLEEMMSERGFEIDHTTLYRWVQHYAPELQKRLDWPKKRYASRWHLDETYIRIKGEWKYLYRAIDERGNTIDFYLSHRRNAKAAKRLLKKLINSNPTCDVSINTDKNPAYGQAIKELKQEGSLASGVSHLQIKYRNNRLETDHGKLKRLINPVRGFQSMKTAYATIRGVEIMHMFKKGQFNIWMYGNRTEISFINEQFGIYN